MYNKKRELQSIGIEENNTGKISGMYSNQKTRKNIEKKVNEGKKKMEAKIERDKIIRRNCKKWRVS